MLLMLFVPSKVSEEVEEMLSALPRHLSWPDTVVLQDYTTDPLTASLGAELKVGDTDWTIKNDRGHDDASKFLIECPDQSGVTAVDVSWGPEIDLETGVIWAVPTFTGIRIESGPGSLTALCTTLGFVRRKLIEAPKAPKPASVIINGVTVPVTAAPWLDERLFGLALESSKFLDWAASLDADFVVSKVVIQSVDEFPKGKVGFLKINASITRDGKFVPGITFIRGDSVGILVVLRCQGEKHTLLTVQPRSSIGKAAFVEIPAGMLDGSGNFAGVAANELGQEADIHITADDLANGNLRELVAGNDEPIAMSPGACDEMMHLFVYETEVTKERLVELDGKCTGEIAENENIVLKLIQLFEIWSIPDAKTLAAAGLYSAHLMNTWLPIP